MPTQIATAPVGEAERHEAVDLLRGVAVLGILLVNMQLFAMPGAASVNPYALGQPSHADLTIWSAIQVLAESKFMAIFSMLFGAGIVLMTGRLEQRGVTPARVHYRRMAWLLVFGLVHAYVLWHGDILVFYAICGMLVYPVRRLGVGTLVTIGVGMLVVGTAISVVSGLTWPSWPQEAKAVWQQYWQPAASDIASETAAFRGGWLAQEPWRFGYAADSHVSDTLSWAIWRAGGLMVLGMALLKSKVLTGGRTRGYYMTLAAVGLGAGLPLVAWGLDRFYVQRLSLVDSVFFVPVWNYWGSILVALGYIGLTMTWWKANVLRGPVARLSAVGRTAFSCYILETLICTTVFYGHGLGLFGTFNRQQQLILTVVIWIILLIAAPLWLRLFRYGPLEWVWRTLTYGHRVPLSREPRESLVTL